MGYVNRKNKYNNISIKINDPELVQQVKDHCKRMNIGASDFVTECVRTCMKDAYALYLKSLSKEDLIELVMSKQKDDEK